MLTVENMLRAKEALKAIPQGDFRGPIFIPLSLYEAAKRAGIDLSNFEPQQKTPDAL